MTTEVSTIQKLRNAIPEKRREEFYRVVAGVTTFLLAFGVLDNQEAALWTQLGLATVTCLFALLYSTSAWRSAIYALAGPAGAVLMAYGLVGDQTWALVVAAVAQLFGITTAASKVTQRDYTLAA
ncbi:holin [Gordonia phage Evaa]|nr:holin [Gordonia phage Evaa]